MKKFNLFLSVILTVALLASCSKEGNDTPAGGEGNPAKLTISVTSPSTRANTDLTDFEDPLDASYDEVKNFSVFITDNTGEIVTGWSEYSATGAAITGKTITTEAQHVYVVANGGDLTSTITTKAALDAYTIDLATAAQNQTTGRWATGQTSTPLSFTQNASGDFEATTTVTLTFVAVRVTLVINDGMGGAYDATNTNDELVLQSVAILNARSKSKLFGSNLLVTPAHYFSGIANNSFTYWPATGTVDENEAIMIDLIPADDFGKKYYYYVFENDAVTAANLPTIVTVHATFDNRDVYYPVHLAPYEQLTGTNPITAAGITRGNSYDITVNLNVDPTTDPGGTVDPTKPLVTADVDINIALTPWVPVPMVKDFN